MKRGSRFATFNDFVDAAKAQPNKLSYGTSGIGGLPHLAMEDISSQLGLKLLHVPFQGTMPAIMAAMSDQIDLVIGDLPHPEIRPLAVISDERVASMSGVLLLAQDKKVRDAAIYGLFGAATNVTDGRYTYFKFPADMAAQEL